MKPDRPFPRSSASWPALTRPIPLLLFCVGVSLALLGCRAAHTHPAPAQHSLQLNGGQKWLVPKPMMAHLENLEQAVRDFEAQPRRGHAALATAIQDNLGRLVTNCTLEGKAHDELHKWLMPLLGLSAEYTKATEPQVQAELLGKIKQSLALFHEYFA